MPLAFFLLWLFVVRQPEGLEGLGMKMCSLELSTTALEVTIMEAAGEGRALCMCSVNVHTCSRVDPPPPSLFSSELALYLLEIVFEKREEGHLLIRACEHHPHQPVKYCLQFAVNPA